MSSGAAWAGTVCSRSHRPKCARVDSNHHGPSGPQGPQPCTPAPYTSASVQIVLYVRVRGHIGHTGRTDICQRFVTGKGSIIH